MTLVVDASAIAAVLFAEPEGETIRAHVRDESLLAPQLIDYELANICWKRIRRQPGTQVEMLSMLTGVDSLAIKRVMVPASEVVELAVRTGLTAYDASYLWLAMSRDLELVTLDHQLARVNQALRERFV
jgi:predicted nucleic acid-binding protein